MNKMTRSQKLEPVILCEQVPFKRIYNFNQKESQQIQDCVMKNNNVEEILKYIHQKFADEGLRYTLINKLFTFKPQDLDFYVPEFVYIAVKKFCKPMRKFLISKASQNSGNEIASQNICRLILWNLKAFTVLMKQKNEQIKLFVEQFEQKIQRSIKNIPKFTHSEKAIATLTTASLILKQFQKKVGEKKFLKEKLKKFIKRFNSQYLSNYNHRIIIPFRKIPHQNFHSTYVVRIIEDDCSCFPTRKRVPYRIMIQTIDEKQLRNKDATDIIFKPQRVIADPENDLFDQVTKNVQKMSTGVYKAIQKDSLFLTNNEQTNKYKGLTSFKIQIQKQESEKRKQQKKLTKTMFRDRQKSIVSQMSHKSQDLQGCDKLSKKKTQKYKIEENDNLKKFNATYIPTIASDIRNSSVEVNHMQKSGKRIRKQKNERWSGINKNIFERVKEVEEVTQYNLAGSDSVWGESFESKTIKYKSSSLFAKFSSRKIHNVVVKGGDDLRQEIICMQLIYKMRDIMVEQNVQVSIFPYQIIVLSQNSGLLQFVANSISIDGLKKQNNMPLLEFFQETFTQKGFEEAKLNFIKSLAGSSVLTYVLKLKDRHNGNILLDNNGNIIHIDFGFILGMSPGGVNFETSPFKFTEEYVDLMGGKDSEDYMLFKKLFCQAMMALRKRSQQLCLILEIMMESSDLQCFQKFTIQDFRERFKPQLNNDKYIKYCENLVQRSCMNSWSANYDYFQFLTNGIQR